MADVNSHQLDLQTDLAGYPLLAASFKTWNKWRAGAPGPTWDAVDLMEIPTELIPSTIVVDVIDGGRDLRFRFWGSSMVAIYGVEISGKTFSEVSENLFGGLPHPQYQYVIDRGDPALFRVTFRRPNDIQATRINLRLPIFDDGGRVDKVLTIAEISQERWLNPLHPGR